MLRPDHRLTGEIFTYLFLVRTQKTLTFTNAFSFTAAQVRVRVANIIFARPQIRHLDQFVPTLPTDEVKKSKEKSLVNRVSFDYSVKGLPL